jgi:hypothetical protein
MNKMQMQVQRFHREVMNGPTSPAAGVLARELMLRGKREREECERAGCDRRVAYPGAIYCGAACSALAEAGE